MNIIIFSYMRDDIYTVKTVSLSTPMSRSHQFTFLAVLFFWGICFVVVCGWWLLTVFIIIMLVWCLYNDLYISYSSSFDCSMYSRHRTLFATQMYVSLLCVEAIHRYLCLIVNWNSKINIALVLYKPHVNQLRIGKPNGSQNRRRKNQDVTKLMTKKVSRAITINVLCTLRS